MENQNPPKTKDMAYLIELCNKAGDLRRRDVKKQILASCAVQSADEFCNAIRNWGKLHNTHPSAIYFKDESEQLETINLKLQEETLSDGSKALNVVVSFF